MTEAALSVGLGWLGVRGVALLWGVVPRFNLGAYNHIAGPSRPVPIPTGCGCAAWCDVATSEEVRDDGESFFPMG